MRGWREGMPDEPPGPGDMARHRTAIAAFILVVFRAYRVHEKLPGDDDGQCARRYRPIR